MWIKEKAEKIVERATVELQQLYKCPVHITVDLSLIISVGELKEIILREFGLSWEEMTSESKKQFVVMARRFFIYFAHLYMKLHESDIAFLLNMDRSSVLQSAKTCQDLLSVNDVVYVKHLESLEKQIFA